eukprot:1094594-Amphidinium_carterae.1
MTIPPSSCNLLGQLQLTKLAPPGSLLRNTWHLTPWPFWVQGKQGGQAASFRPTHPLILDTGRDVKSAIGEHSCSCHWVGKVAGGSVGWCVRFRFVVLFNNLLWYLLPPGFHFTKSKLVLQNCNNHLVGERTITDSWMGMVPSP